MYVSICAICDVTGINQLTMKLYTDIDDNDANITDTFQLYSYSA